MIIEPISEFFNITSRRGKQRSRMTNNDGLRYVTAEKEAYDNLEESKDHLEKDTRSDREKYETPDNIKQSAIRWGSSSGYPGIERDSD